MKIQFNSFIQQNGKSTTNQIRKLDLFDNIDYRCFVLFAFEDTERAGRRKGPQEEMVCWLASGGGGRGDGGGEICGCH